MEFLGTDLRHGGPNGPSAFRPRVNSQASASSITPDIGAYDAYDLTALAANLTVNSPTGTPYDFQELTIRIADNGTARTISWGGDYRQISAVALPSLTIGWKIYSLTFRYHSGLGTWLCVDQTISNSKATNIERLHGATALFPMADAARTINLSTMFASHPLQEGDLVILATANRSTSAAPLTSGGWTSAASATADGTNDTTLALLYKFMGSTPDSSIEFSSSSFPSAVVAYRGVNAATPLDVAPTTASQTSAHNPNPPSNTPSNGGTVSVVAGAATGFGAISFNASGISNFLTGEAIVAPSTHRIAIGMGERFNEGTSSFDPPAWTGGHNSTNNTWAAAHLILRSS